jgi:hypothetical protein
VARSHEIEYAFKRMALFSQALQLAPAASRSSAFTSRLELVDPDAYQFGGT